MGSSEFAQEIYPWGLLDPGYVGRSIVNTVISDWNNLLNVGAIEKDYHQFVAEHAGFFFGASTSIVISRLKLGSDLETDFVLVTDHASYGFIYELIELETPHISPTTGSSDYSARLTHAVGQIIAWEDWLKDHPEEVRKLFPSKLSRLYGERNFAFSIYIGRRDDERTNLIVRNRLSRKLGIEIRSFDSLTDRLETRQFSSFPPSISEQMKGFDNKTINQLANPFFKASQHSDWKRIVTDQAFEPFAHMLAKNATLLLRYRAYNNRLKDFIRVYDALPQDEKQRWNRVMNDSYDLHRRL